MDETHADEFILASLPPLLCPARLRVGRGGVRGAKEGLSGRGMDLRFPKSPFQEKNDSEPCRESKRETKKDRVRESQRERERDKERDRERERETKKDREDRESVV